MTVQEEPPPPRSRSWRNVAWRATCRSLATLTRAPRSSRMMLVPSTTPNRVWRAGTSRRKAEACSWACTPRTSRPVADKMRNDLLFWPDEDACKARVVPDVNHWSCLGIQLHAGTPLNARNWATQLLTPVCFAQCIQSIYQQGVAVRELVVFLDLGMGPRLLRLVSNTLEDTPEWKSGQMAAVMQHLYLLPHLYVGGVVR